MIVYVVTDRRLRPDLDPEDLVERIAASGADMMQIREKDLGAASVLGLARRAVAAGGAPVMVNGRPDVAMCAGAAGVHLPADGLPAVAIRARWPEALRIGASTHSVAEARAAEAGSADFITFGPVFETESKRRYGPPAGIGKLVHVVEAVRIPVLAIGGITPDRVREIARVPVAGIAVISAVVGAADMAGAVARLRAAAGGA